jgi:hypothetical protein
MKKTQILIQRLCTFIPLFAARCIGVVVLFAVVSSCRLINPPDEQKRFRFDGVCETCDSFYKRKYSRENVLSFNLTTFSTHKAFIDSAGIAMYFFFPDGNVLISEGYSPLVLDSIIRHSNDTWQPFDTTYKGATIQRIGNAYHRKSVEGLEWARYIIFDDFVSIEFFDGKTYEYYVDAYFEHGILSDDETTIQIIQLPPKDLSKPKPANPEHRIPLLIVTDDYSDIPIKSSQSWVQFYVEIQN